MASNSEFLYLVVLINILGNRHAARDPCASAKFYLDVDPMLLTECF